MVYGCSSDLHKKSNAVEVLSYRAENACIVMGASKISDVASSERSIAGGKKW
jgi:hypothetical protein